MTNWTQIFTGLLFYAYVEIHQLKASLWQLAIVSTAFNKMSFMYKKECDGLWIVKERETTCQLFEVTFKLPNQFHPVYVLLIYFVFVPGVSSLTYIVH